MTDIEKHNIELLAHRTISRFIDYQKAFREFKKVTGLKPIENTHECVSGAVDKLGRLTRHVKHNIRNDPKDSFPQDAIESFEGCLAYLDLIMESFNLSEEQVRDSMLTELMKSVKQHTKKDQ